MVGNRHKLTESLLFCRYILSKTKMDLSFRVVIVQVMEVVVVVQCKTLQIICINVFKTISCCTVVSVL
jgi:hypothetical protein